MPLQSKAQGRYLNWKFGHDWVKEHHFGGPQKGLPQRVKAQAGTTNVGLALLKAMQQKQKKKPSRA
jgi:hypothetical protein